MTRIIPMAKPSLGRSERRQVNRVLKTGMLAQGKEVLNFENEYSRTVRGQHCVAVNSGTSALHISLLALGIGPRHEVIVPSFTFAATANAVALTGATPVFVDVDLDTFNIEIESILDSISPKTKAILPVHLYGQPAPMLQISDIARQKNLFVIEDASQAHLARIGNQPVGTFGDAGTFSFYPTKNMTTGEGGMITTFSNDLADQAKLYRNQGMKERYKNEVIGLNNRMTEMNASIGRVQLKKLETWTEKRRKNASFFDKHLEGVKIPSVKPDFYHVYHQYTIRVLDHDRNRFAQEVNKLGVETGVYYPTPVNKLQSFNTPAFLPNTEVITKDVLSIPVHPSLSRRDLERIVEVVNKVARAGA
jgi:perosamine synthetase